MGCALVDSGDKMKQIVFTFDDGLDSHLTKVAPFFKEHDFNATFYVSGKRDMWKKDMLSHLIEDPLADSQVVEIHKMGFEIGNHTLNHSMAPATLQKDVIGMENNLRKLGIDKPTTFCAPAYRYFPKAKVILKKLGYTCCRIGYALKYDRNIHIDPSDIRDKVRYHTPGDFIVYSTMVLNDWYGFDHFKKDLDAMPEDKVAIVTAHGLICDKRWEHLQKCLLYAKSKGYHGATMKDMQSKQNLCSALDKED